MQKNLGQTQTMAVLRKNVPTSEKLVRFHDIQLVGLDLT